MECPFDDPPSCCALESSSKIAIGFADGTIGVYSISTPKSKDPLKSLWSYRLKRAVRALEFSPDGGMIYSLSRNRALCSFDVQTGKRLRVIREAHDDKPHALCILPPSATKGQQFATGDESGQIRTWDFRAKDPIICTFDDQDETVNALAMWNNTLISASSDGTVAAYEVRRRKLLMQSEAMHSELLSIAVGSSHTYVGSGDGHIEVFKNGDYGNILERIETPFDSVDCCVSLRKGLIATASFDSDVIRMFHVAPNRRLGVFGRHGMAVDKLAKSPDGEILVSISPFDHSIKIFPLKKMLEKVPVLRADSIQKTKGKKKDDGNFFDGLMEDDEGGSDDSGEEGSDDEEEGDESDDENEDTQEDGHDGNEENDGEEEQTDEEVSDDEEEGEGEDIPRQVNGRVINEEEEEESDDEDLDEDVESSDEEEEDNGGPVIPRQANRNVAIGRANGHMAIRNAVNGEEEEDEDEESDEEIDEDEEGTDSDDLEEAELRARKMNSPLGYKRMRFE